MMRTASKPIFDDKTAYMSAMPSPPGVVRDRAPACVRCFVFEAICREK